MTADIAEVVVIGAGPAGVAAALMADSLGMRAVVVESSAVASKLQLIGALANVPGGWSNGRALADAMTADLRRVTDGGGCRLIHGVATEVRGLESTAEVALADGRVLTGGLIVVATGVQAVSPANCAWLNAADDVSTPPLWRARPEALRGRTYVLGADRPLGTWLRTHTDNTRLHVLCPPEDDYKMAEVSNDPRVRRVDITSASLVRDQNSDGTLVHVTMRSGEEKSFLVTTVLSNLGSRPGVLGGLVVDDSGYCPPHLQHDRIAVVGDLRSPQFQRIAVAQGTGAEAVLRAYYRRVEVTAA